MSANVETMMYVREKPWHGLGIELDNPATSKDAIVASGLDWNVLRKPIYNDNGEEIPGFKANTRDKDNSVLGIVSNRYKIVQNSDAFDFTDSLINDGMTYETAGSLNDGKRIWLLGKFPDEMILNDKLENYICFVNTHDGSGSIKVCMTPVRVVCNNTLNLALKTSKRNWSTRHVGDIKNKLIEARETLGLANAYIQSLKDEADLLANKKITDSTIEGIFDSLFPIDYKKDSSRKINNVLNMKNGLFTCLKAADILQYKDTAWGAMMAVTDWADHSIPNRITDSYQENNWGKIISGHPFVDAMYEKIKVA